jgi:hypothetical protein
MVVAARLAVDDGDGPLACPDTDDPAGEPVLGCGCRFVVGPALVAPGPADVFGGKIGPEEGTSGGCVVTLTEVEPAGGCVVTLTEAEPPGGCVVTLTEADPAGEDTETVAPAPGTGAADPPGPCVPGAVAVLAATLAPFPDAPLGPAPDVTPTVTEAPPLADGDPGLTVTPVFTDVETVAPIGPDWLDADA